MGEEAQGRVRKVVFFDLDGTLLPLNMEEFIAEYNAAIKESGFYERISEEEGERFFGKAIRAMLKNDGSKLNSEVFYETIESLSGKTGQYLMPYADDFYNNGFRRVKKCSHMEKKVTLVINELKNKNYRLVISTNPLFPKSANDQRISWAGLDVKDFEYVSYYDNSSYCKPKSGYYIEILSKLGLKASECYIVGNDVIEDMSAVELGFSGFLVTDNMIGEIERAPKCETGDYSELLRYAESLPALPPNSI